jgi:hypothetical protein
MKRKIAMTIVGAALALATTGAAPPSAPPLRAPLLVLEPAAAAPVTKSLDSGGGGSVGGAGDRLGDLLSGWGVPVLIALAGILLVGTLTARNIGASVGIVLITLVGLIFLLAPQSIETAAKGIAGIVF